MRNKPPSSSYFTHTSYVLFFQILLRCHAVASSFAPLVPRISTHYHRVMPLSVVEYGVSKTDTKVRLKMWQRKKSVGWRGGMSWQRNTRLITGGVRRDSHGTINNDCCHHLVRQPGGSGAVERFPCWQRRLTVTPDRHSVEPRRCHCRGNMGAWK